MPTDQSRSINPLRLAKAKERIVGSLQLASLARLKGLLLENKGELKYSLTFDYDEAGVCVVGSSIESQLILQCQRCFEPVEVEIKKSSLLGVVNDDEDAFDSLTREYEPLQLNDSIITVEELVEDELLLSIPLSALHPLDQCTAIEDLERINAEAKLNPFSGLAALIKDKD